MGGREVGRGARGREGGGVGRGGREGDGEWEGGRGPLGFPPSNVFSDNVQSIR